MFARTDLRVLLAENNPQVIKHLMATKQRSLLMTIEIILNNSHRSQCGDEARAE